MDEYERREEARKQFIAKLANGFVGKTITAIRGDTHLHFTFDDGTTLLIIANGRETFDGAEWWLKVNGTSLNDPEDEQD